MYLNQLELRNFRNYQELKLKFSEQINVFIGKNAQGKTNLLEAIALLCLGKPIRTKKDNELIKWGTDHCFCRGQFQENDNYTLVEVGIGVKEKRIKINGQAVKNNSVFGQIPIVIFSPDDLQLVKGAPQERRDFIDIYLAQIEPKYRFVYYNFFKVLQQRNRLLKQGFVDRGELDAWNEQLIEKGTKVIKYRNSLINSVKPFIGAAQQTISGDKEFLNLEYVSFNNQIIPNDETEIKSKFQEELLKVKDYELQRGMTLIGPHRDDLRLTINHEIELRSYGSQGQQRTAALALKLGLVEKIKEARGMYPLILLDDVMSEFDDHRKQHLLQLLISSSQTFLTSTSKQDFPLQGQQTHFFSVNQGEIQYVE
ncbi:MAG: DNA replication/repair protein RecF [Bacteroidota bacterium]